MFSGIMPFCKVLALLRPRRVGRVDSRREKDCDDAVPCSPSVLDRAMEANGPRGQSAENFGHICM